MPERIVWTSPDGIAIDLTDEAAGYSVLANGTRGLRSVTYEMTTTTYAGIDGETVDAIRATANQPTIGLLLRAEDDDDFEHKARRLVRVMRPKAGLGTLAVSTRRGETRSLSCYCIGGLEGDEATDVTMAGAWWKLALKLYAPDPWWWGELQRIDVGLGASQVFFPIPPVNLGASTVQGQFVIDLADSDAPTFPRWTITGPGASLVLRNDTTGREITVAASLPVGDTMVIDTRPDRQSVRRGDGTNLMGAVTSDPSLWPLIDGVNEITVALAGAASTSRIQGTFSPRFAGI